MNIRLTVAGALLALLALASASALAAGTFPERPITMVVPFVAVARRGDGQRQHQCG